MPAPDDSQKDPFDIDRAMELVRDAVKPYPPAALFHLAEADGFASLFEIVVGCIISIRTRDEDALPVTRRLFAHSRTPREIADLGEEMLIALLDGATYPEPKARQVKEIARVACENENTLPADYDFLLTLPGIGPKCANLSLGVATGDAPHVPVDIHVHRVTNRWGIVQTKTPEKTLVALETALPARYRVEINRLLVPFGKHVCTGTFPRCSTCPLLSLCPQVGVGSAHR